MKRSALSKDITVIKGMHLNIKIHEENPERTRRSREIHCSSWSVNTLFTVIVRSSRQKISKDRVHSNNTISQVDLTDTYGSLYPAAEWTLYLRSHGEFIMIDHILALKTHPDMLKTIAIIQSMFLSNPNWINIEISYRKVVEKSQNVCRLDNTYKWQSNERRNLKWKEKIYFEINENENKQWTYNWNLKSTTQHNIT